MLIPVSGPADGARGDIGKTHDSGSGTGASGGAGGTADRSSPPALPAAPIETKPTTTVQPGSGAAAALPRGASPESSQVTPMADRLRALIVDYQSRDRIAPIRLHEVSQQVAVARESASAQAPATASAGLELAPDVVEWTRAAIVADAATALGAQATLGPDSVLALLRLPH